jgi:hypothetical protein
VSLAKDISMKIEDSLRVSSSDHTESTDGFGRA